jgi:hypothetical protein
VQGGPVEDAIAAADVTELFEIRRYGQRPETAKWQSNSSPF